MFVRICVCVYIFIYTPTQDSKKVTNIQRTVLSSPTSKSIKSMSSPVNGLVQVYRVDLVLA